MYFIVILWFWVIIVNNVFLLIKRVVIFFTFVSRMCRALMPGDEESMSDEAIWETLPVSCELRAYVICSIAYNTFS